jgi:hypothetical protein
VKRKKTIEIDLGDQVMRFNQDAIDREIIKAARDRLPKEGTPSRFALDLSKTGVSPKK